jgi:hypothetical protein
MITLLIGGLVMNPPNETVLSKFSWVKTEDKDYYQTRRHKQSIKVALYR